jgi:hypothetical protein
MRQIRKGVRLNHVSPKPRTEQRQTKNPNIQFPSPEEYVPLPQTWEDFQTLQSQYGHSMWDLCSPQEYYKWTKDWTWDQVAGHQPTEEMRKNEWEPQPIYKQIDLEEAYITSPLPAKLTQCMNAFEIMPRVTPPTKRKRPMTIRLKTSLSTRLKRGAIQHTQYPNQTVPGTPDPEPKSTSPDTTEDIELYYRIFNNFRPEQSESNAESADRTMKINKEYARPAFETTT